MIEKYTGKTFIYKTVDLNTRDVINISYTKKQLEIQKHRATARTMAEKCGADHVRHFAELRTGLEMLASITGYIFTQVLTKYGYGVRDGQIDLSEQMLTALNQRRISISEAAVGTGKTFAYLIAAVLLKLGNNSDFWIRTSYKLSRDFQADSPLPVVISTSSIALQQAITQGCIPEISRILLKDHLIKRPLSCVVRKGKEHYVCEVRLRDYIPHTDVKTQAILISVLNDDSVIDLGSMDTGVISILDSRVRIGGWCRDVVLGALPLCRVVSRIKEVERFIKAVKDISYFQ